VPRSCSLLVAGARVDAREAQGRTAKYQSLAYHKQANRTVVQQKVPALTPSPGDGQVAQD
jgi:hypothetical protein